MTDAVNAESRFELGLIVGKFAPLHAGHEFLIDTAAAQCRELLILSYCNPELEHCDPATRRRWLSNRFSRHTVMVLDAADLAERCRVADVAVRPLPNNDASDDDQQRFLGWLLRAVLQRRPDAFFCSEAYGPACAATLTRLLAHPVTAIVVDRERETFPISASRLRQQPDLRQRWLSAEVRADFVQRIALLGGESSGKTTLASALAVEFATEWVPEYGRELWEQKSGCLTESDLLVIAREQIRRESLAQSSADRYLFCDTSPLTTAGYSGWMFGHLSEQLERLATRTYSGAVLCRPDFPFVQDGTRREADFRMTQHRWYLDQLRNAPYPVVEVTGDVPTRVSTVKEWLPTLRR